MQTFSRVYYAPDGKEFILDELEERLRLTRIDDYYVDEQAYERDASRTSRAEKDYLLVQSDEGGDYGISGKLLQCSYSVRTVAVNNDMSPDEAVKSGNGSSINYLSSISHGDAAVLLGKLNLRMPGLEELLGLIKGVGTGGLRKLNGETLDSDGLKAVHSPLPEIPDTWMGEYLGDRILYSRGQWRIKSVRQEAGRVKTSYVSVNDSGIAERYREEIEAAGGRFSFIRPSYENSKPRIPIFLAGRERDNGLIAILDCNRTPDHVPTGVDIGVRPVLYRPSGTAEYSPSELSEQS